MFLEKFTRGRDNNLNLMRLILALTVLISHSYPLALGFKGVDPLYGLVGMTMGSVAVDLFFLTSGFLVTASLLSRNNATDFVISRVLRIYPALLVILALTVFFIGPLFTTIPLSEYFSSKETYVYLYKNITLIAGGWDRLPGVFKDNPYAGAVNGSLWTLTYELLMYLILVSVWVVIRAASKNNTVMFRSAIVLIFCVSGFLTVLIKMVGIILPMAAVVDALAKLSFMFFSGSLFYIFKHRVRLSGLVFFVLASLVVVSACYVSRLFYVVYMLSVGYILFYMAYVPSGFVRAYNKVGDYSYGIYIFAFPVQQIIAAMCPGISVWSMTLVSVSLVLLLAIGSWHAIEKPALQFKGRVSLFFRSLFQREKDLVDV